MPLGNLPADRQAHTGALIFTAPVQALENRKNEAQVFFVKADSVVFDYDPATFPVSVAIGRQPGSVPVQVLGMDLHKRRNIFPMKLQGVADEILEQLSDLRGVGLEAGQLPYFHSPARLFNPHLQV